MVLEPNEQSVREETVREGRRPTRAAKVTKVYSHTKADDNSNHEVKIQMLRGQEEKYDNVPVAVGSIGEVRVPTEGNTVLVDFFGGDSKSPVVTQVVYGTENRAPIGRPGDWRVRKDGALMEIRSVPESLLPMQSDSDSGGGNSGRVKALQIGFDDGDGSAIQHGLIIAEDGRTALLDESSEDVLLQVEENTQSSGGGSGEAPGSGSGVLPDTSSDAPPMQRAEDAGLNISNTVNVSSISDIENASSNTLYIVDGSNGPLQASGKHGLGNVSDVAICGKNDAVLKVSSGYGHGNGEYSITASGGSGLMWSDIDLDQTANGAFARLNFNVDDRGFYEYFKTIGKGRNPGDYPPNGQAQLHVPAKSGSGTVRLKNASLIHGGRNTNQHKKYTPIGIHFGDNDHVGTLNIVDSQIEEFPNNGIYASASPGTINVSGGRFYNNAVGQVRFANGKVEGATVGYDYNNTGMANADSPHGVKGVAGEQKKSASGGVIQLVKNCTFDFPNVQNFGGAVNTYTATSGNHVGTVGGCDFELGNVGGVAAITAVGGPVDEVNNSNFNQSRSDAFSGNIGSASGNNFNQ